MREFFADYFSSYHAFQALRLVSGTMRQAQAQWREMRRLKAAGATKDMWRLYAALDESIVEMFSCTQLKGGGLRLNFAEHVELDPFAINERFYDIEVRRALQEAA